MAQKESYTFRVGSGLLDRLRSTSHESRIPASELIRDALEKYLPEVGEAFEVEREGE